MNLYEELEWTRAELERAHQEARESAGEAGRLHRLVDEAWGIICSAANFEHTIVCAHRHCAEREHELVFGMTEPIGSQEWRDAAHRWGVRAGLRMKGEGKS